MSIPTYTVLAPLLLIPAALVLRKLKQRREARTWAAEAAERVRTAEYLAWLELRFIDMEAEERS